MRIDGFHLSEWSALLYSYFKNITNHANLIIDIIIFIHISIHFIFYVHYSQSNRGTICREEQKGAIKGA